MTPSPRTVVAICVGVTLLVVGVAVAITRRLA